MPYAIEMFFDEELDATIRSVWNKLAERKLAPYLAGCGSRPHVSLAVYDDLDVPTAEDRLKSFAASLAPFSMMMWNLGIFSSPPVVFYAPQVTQGLLALHSKFHDHFQGLGQGPAEYYLPGRWVPHCALAVRVEPSRLPRVVDTCRKECPPVSGEVREIGIVRFLPVVQLCAFGLTGADAGPSGESRT